MRHSLAGRGAGFVGPESLDARVPRHFSGALRPNDTHAFLKSVGISLNHECGPGPSGALHRPIGRASVMSDRIGGYRCWPGFLPSHCQSIGTTDRTNLFERE